MHCPLDPVPMWSVKHASATDVLAPIVTTICNASLQSGCFPDFYKQARLKKPSLNPDDFNSFHSISNLSLLSKIIEYVEYAIHPSHRSERAYRRFNSTESAVLVIHNDIVPAIDDGHVAALALLNLSSAFDSVDHATLLSILQFRFSVTEQPLEWFRSYLTGRTQVFTTHSSQITSGVPQGSSCSSTIYPIHRMYN